MNEPIRRIVTVAEPIDLKVGQRWFITRPHTHHVEEVKITDLTQYTIELEFHEPSEMSRFGINMPDDVQRIRYERNKIRFIERRKDK